MAIEEVNGIFDPRPNASPATRGDAEVKGHIGLVGGGPEP